MIRSRTGLANILGSTKAGLILLKVIDRKDWAYTRVSPVFGSEYRQVSENLSEQVIVRGKTSHRNQDQAVVGGGRYCAAAVLHTEGPMQHPMQIFYQQPRLIALHACTSKPSA